MDVYVRMYTHIYFLIWYLKCNEARTLSLILCVYHFYSIIQKYQEIYVYLIKIQWS